MNQRTKNERSITGRGIENKARRAHALEVHLLSQCKKCGLLLLTIQLMLYFGVSTFMTLTFGLIFETTVCFLYSLVIYHIARLPSHQLPIPQFYPLWRDGSRYCCCPTTYRPSVHLKSPADTDSFHLHLSSLPKGFLWHQGEQCQELMSRQKPSITGTWVSSNKCLSLLILQ